MFSDPAANLAKMGLGHGMKVVDIGAGTGFYSVEAARMVGPAGRIYAVDVMKDLLERLRMLATKQGIRNIEVIWGDAEKLGGTRLRDGIADRVIASNVLFQIAKPDDFALEMKRVLKPGGKIMIVDWSEASAMSPKTLVPSLAAETLFEKNGFRLDQSWNAGDHHYGLLLARA